ncbi:MAG: hypothetical protein M3Q07_01815, partial [Pseudobdellovibrionaceae bacterium]|nr:hypothetical protein [Pseudobdellovibrionaceae bacterium]
LDVSIVKSSDNQMTLNIHNKTDLDLFTWSIACPGDFQLVDRLGKTFQAEAMGSNWRKKFRYPLDPFSSLRKNEVLTMDFHFNKHSDSFALGSCNVNGIAVTLKEVNRPKIPISPS